MINKMINKQKKFNCEGFTFVELLIVMWIIGFVGSMGVVTLFTHVEVANYTAARVENELLNVQKMNEEIQRDFSDLSNQDDVLSVLKSIQAKSIKMRTSYNSMNTVLQKMQFKNGAHLEQLRLEAKIGIEKTRQTIAVVLVKGDESKNQKQADIRSHVASVSVLNCSEEQPNKIDFLVQQKKWDELKQLASQYEDNCNPFAEYLYSEKFSKQDGVERICLLQSALQECVVADEMTEAATKIWTALQESNKQ